MNNPRIHWHKSDKKHVLNRATQTDETYNFTELEINMLYFMRIFKIDINCLSNLCYGVVYNYSKQRYTVDTEIIETDSEDDEPTLKGGDDPEVTKLIEESNKNKELIYNVIYKSDKSILQKIKNRHRLISNTCTTTIEEIKQTETIGINTDLTVGFSDVVEIKRIIPDPPIDIPDRITIPVVDDLQVSKTVNPRNIILNKWAKENTTLGAKEPLKRRSSPLRLLDVQVIPPKSQKTLPHVAHVIPHATTHAPAANTTNQLYKELTKTTTPNIEKRPQPQQQHLHYQQQHQQQVHENLPKPKQYEHQIKQHLQLQQQQQQYDLEQQQLQQQLQLQQQQHQHQQQKLQHHQPLQQQQLEKMQQQRQQQQLRSSAHIANARQPSGGASCYIPSRAPTVSVEHSVLIDSNASSCQLSHHNQKMKALSTKNGKNMKQVPPLVVPYTISHSHRSAYVEQPISLVNRQAEDSDKFQQQPRAVSNPRPVHEYPSPYIQANYPPIQLDRLSFLPDSDMPVLRSPDRQFSDNRLSQLQAITDNHIKHLRNRNQLEQLQQLRHAHQSVQQQLEQQQFFENQQLQQHQNLLKKHIDYREMEQPYQQHPSSHYRMPQLINSSHDQEGQQITQLAPQLLQLPQEVLCQQVQPTTTIQTSTTVRNTNNQIASNNTFPYVNNIAENIQPVQHPPQANISNLCDNQNVPRRKYNSKSNSLRRPRRDNRPIEDAGPVSRIPEAYMTVPGNQMWPHAYPQYPHPYMASMGPNAQYSARPLDRTPPEWLDRSTTTQTDGWTTGFQQTSRWPQDHRLHESSRTQHERIDW